MRKASLSPDFSTRCRNSCAKLSARSGLALVWAIGLPSALSDIASAIHDNPLRPLRRACARHGLILLGVPTAVWPKRELAARLGWRGAKTRVRPGPRRLAVIRQ